MAQQGHEIDLHFPNHQRYFQSFFLLPDFICLIVKGPVLTPVILNASIYFTVQSYGYKLHKAIQLHQSANTQKFPDS